MELVSSAHSTTPSSYVRLMSAGMHSAVTPCGMWRVRRHSRGPHSSALKVSKRVDGTQAIAEVLASGKQPRGDCYAWERGIGDF